MSTRDPYRSTNDETRTTYSSYGGGAAEQQDMKDRATEATSEAREKADEARHKAMDAANKAKERADRMMHETTAKVDQQRDTVAGRMDSAASTIESRAQSMPGGERTQQMAHMAADRLHSTAGYVRQHDVNDMMTDIERYVRTHPTQSLAIAAAAGFLVGRVIRG